MVFSRKPRKPQPKLYPIMVMVDEGESIDAALKRFAKVVKKSGITEDVKKAQYFEKPSDERRRKKNRSRRRSEDQAQGNS